MVPIHENFEILIFQTASKLALMYIVMIPAPLDFEFLVRLML